MGLFSSTEKKTPAEWKEHLSRENTPMTLEEYIAGILLKLSYYVMNSDQALNHLEGMVGAIDESFERHDEEYKGSATVREALHRHRRALSALADQHTDVADAVRIALSARRE